MVSFHNNETQLSLFETPHYPLLRRLLILRTFWPNGFIWSLYLEFLICSIQLPSTWEQFKHILLKNDVSRPSSDALSTELYWLFSNCDPQENLKASHTTHHFLFQFSSSCPPPALRYFDCCIYQGVPNQVSFLKKDYITNGKKIFEQSLL